MKIDALLTDDAVLDELGKRVAHARLARQLTQAQLAEQAGIAKRTLERIESGHSSQLDTLIRVLRALGDMAGLDTLLPEATPTPMQLLKGQPRRRQRAPRQAVKEPQPWIWGDDP